MFNLRGFGDSFRLYSK